MGFFQIIKKNLTIKKNILEKGKERNAFFFFSNKLTNGETLGLLRTSLTKNNKKKCTFWNIWTLGTFFGTGLIVPLPKSDSAVWSAAAAYGSVKVFVTFNWHHIASTELWKVVVNTSHPPLVRIDPCGEKPACRCRVLVWASDTFQPGRFSSSSRSSVKRVARGDAESLCERKEKLSALKRHATSKLGLCAVWNGISYQTALSLGRLTLPSGLDADLCISALGNRGRSGM